MTIYTLQEQKHRCFTPTKLITELGITNNDLEEIGAESYDQINNILQEILAWKTFNHNNNITYANKKDEKEAFLNEQQMLIYPIKIISAVASRYFSSEFK